MDKTFRALKRIEKRNHIGKRLNADYTLPVNRIERFPKLLRLNYAVHVILQPNGRNQFPTRNPKLVDSAVHVESVANEYICFQNQDVLRFDN